MVKTPFPKHAKKEQPEDGPPISLSDLMQQAGPPPGLGLPPSGPPGPDMGGGTPMGPGPGGPPLAGPMGPGGGQLTPQDMLLAQQLIKKQRIAMLMKAHGGAIKQGSGTNDIGPLSPLDMLKQQFQNQKFPPTLQPQA